MLEVLGSGQGIEVNLFLSRKPRSLTLGLRTDPRDEVAKPSRLNPHLPGFVTFLDLKSDVSWFSNNLERSKTNFSRSCHAGSAWEVLGGFRVAVRPEPEAAGV